MNFMNDEKINVNTPINDIKRFNTLNFKEGE